MPVELTVGRLYKRDNSRYATLVILVLGESAGAGFPALVVSSADGYAKPWLAGDIVRVHHLSARDFLPAEMPVF